VNLSEVVAKLIEDGVPEPQIRLAIGRLELDVHAFDAEHAYIAGVLRKATRASGLSFGDRACLALAQSLGAPALTADRSWSRLDLGIAIEVIR
jgi:ribonuclease VapC